jgi:hypothetical protein
LASRDGRSTTTSSCSISSPRRTRAGPPAGSRRGDRALRSSLAARTSRQSPCDQRPRTDLHATTALLDSRYTQPLDR